MKGTIWQQLCYAIIMPAYFLGATLLYNPFEIRQFLSFGSFNIAFHLVMLSCIILMCTLAARVVLYFVLKHTEFKWWNYGVWCAGEGLFESAFIALYLTLFKSDIVIYFIFLSTSIKFVFLILCYPYALLIFIRLVRIKDECLDARESDKALAKFYDEHHKLKFSISPSSVLYVKAEINYVNIFYVESGKVKSFLIRSSMKTAGPSCPSLVRCHRSYYVNPSRISVLRKDAYGFIYADLNVSGVESVPVSKLYYEAVASKL